MAGAILNPFAEVGDHCIINTGASIDHDCIIQDFVDIVPHCTLCGEVEIGQGTWVGAGTTIIQGFRVGRNCFIGAGSVVVKDIPDGCLCYGNPAKVVRGRGDEREGTRRGERMQRADGENCVLELNPRFGSGYPFSYEAGVNMPRAILQWLKGGQVDPAILQPEYGRMFAKNE